MRIAGVVSVHGRPAQPVLVLRITDVLRQDERRRQTSSHVRGLSGVLFAVDTSCLRFFISLDLYRRL